MKEYTIKTSYRVHNKNLNGIEKELTNYLIKTIDDNTSTERPTLSLSIRVSHKPDNSNRQIYATLLYVNFDSSKNNISEILNLFKSRLESRNIKLENVTAFHIHLHTL
jgi:hypothetical protein